MSSPLKRLLPLIAVAVVAMTALAVAAIALLPRSNSSAPPSGPRAVIVDQLSLTAPDQAFVDNATSLLQAAGYAVDYIPGKQVTVDFYRHLPSHHYAVILFRTHAGLRRTKDGVLTKEAHLFTAEPYSKTKYVSEQLAGRLKAAAYNEAAIARGDLYFGIPETFVTGSMQGNFGGAAVVLMGCDGLRAQKLAQAFVQKGAGAVVGWDDLVTADHTDAATLDLLRHYLVDRMSLQDAAAAARTDAGPDPSSGAVLLAYPPTAAVN